MINIYDKAHELAEALKETDELKKYKGLTDSIEKNEVNKKMIDDFRKIQYEAYTEQMQTGKVSEELDEKFKNLSNVITLNPSVKEYLEAESKFSVLWEDIMKILTEVVQK